MFEKIRESNQKRNKLKGKSTSRKIFDFTGLLSLESVVVTSMSLLLLIVLISKIFSL